MLYVSFAVFLAVFFISCNSIAQYQPTGYVWQAPPFHNQPLQVPAWQYISTGEGDILVDNFEYWDNPSNHGWISLEPFYPVYGFGIGYANVFQTIFDFQKGNRVLDVYRPASVFLLGGLYEKLRISYDLYTPSKPGSTSVQNFIDLTKNPRLSFSFRAPLGIEQWDIFGFDLTGSTKAGHEILVQIRPVQPPSGSGRDVGGSTFNMGGYLPTIVDILSPQGPMVIRVDIGKARDGNGICRMKVDNGSFIGARPIHRQMKKGLLRWFVPFEYIAVPADFGDSVGVESTEAAIRGSN